MATRRKQSPLAMAESALHFARARYTAALRLDDELGQPRGETPWSCEALAAMRAAGDRVAAIHDAATLARGEALYTLGGGR